MTKEAPDINDTLKDQGEDAARARGDRAKRFNSGGNHKSKPNSGPTGQSAHGKAGSLFDWSNPDFSFLDDRRGDLPEFPLDNIAPTVRHWIELAAHGSGVTAGHVAVPLIGIASALIGTARRVEATRAWSEPMTLWTAIVGLSGSGKTPGLDATKRALDIVIRDRGAKIDEMRRRHETRAATAKAALKEWQAAVKKAVHDNDPVPTKPAAADDPGAFVAPVLYVSDSTIERLGVLLTVRPQGVLLLLDELAGLFANMGRYSNGADNQFWLTAWNGSAFAVERMNRPALRLSHLLIGVTGGLQPDKLSESFAGANDGMYARFLFSWPPEATYRELADTTMAAEPVILMALKKLAELGGGEVIDFAPRYVPLDKPALAIFEDFRRHVAEGRDGVYGRERDWWCKQPGHTLRLSGALTFLAWGMDNGPEPKAIGTEFMSAAVTLTRTYFYPHARAALRQIGLTERDADARRALRWMQHARRPSMSRDAIRREALAQRLNAEETQDLLRRLAVAGWVRPLTVAIGPKGGRPASLWEINPVLFDNRG